MTTLILGLGNPILTDDGVGIHVVRAVREAGPPDGTVCMEASVGGLRLLDVLAGNDRVILIDAIQTRGGKPGEIHRLHLDDVRTLLHSGSTHDLSFTGAIALGRQLGMKLPADEDVVVIAVEVADVLTFGEECTPCVVDAIPRAVGMVLDELDR